VHIVCHVRIGLLDKSCHLVILIVNFVSQNNLRSKQTNFVPRNWEET
jgi:hypothetical protein